MFLDEFPGTGLQPVDDDVLWTEAVVESANSGGVVGVVTLEVDVWRDGGSEQLNLRSGRPQTFSVLPHS